MLLSGGHKNQSSKGAMQPQRWLIWLQMLVALPHWGVVQPTEANGLYCPMGQERHRQIDELQTQNRIVGGYKTTLSEFPSYAVISCSQNTMFNPSTEGKLCGASILDEMHLITAAHCVDTPKSVCYVQPSHKFPERFNYTVANQCIARNYARNYEGLPRNDVAIIKVDRPMDLDPKNHHAVDLKFYNLDASEQFFATGVGLSSNKQDVAAYLQGLDVDPQKCYDTITPSALNATCMGPSNPELVGHPCSGDSGSPIYLRRIDKLYVVGLISFSQRVCSLEEVHTFGVANFKVLQPEITRLIEECK